MTLATIDPSCANAFTMPPAAFHSSGSSKNPAAESGSAILYKRPMLNGFFMNSAGNSSKATTTADVTMDVCCTVDSGSSC